MEKKYKVRVNETWEFTCTQPEIDSLDSREISPSHYHIISQHKSFKGEIQEADFLNKAYTVKVKNNTYQVDISDQLDLLIEDMGLSLGQAQVVNDIKAPMPGLILDVNIAEGDEVKEGDYLLVLEAMKMETTIASNYNGRIKSIYLGEGEMVEQDDLIVELE